MWCYFVGMFWLDMSICLFKVVSIWWVGLVYNMIMYYDLVNGFRILRKVVLEYGGIIFVVKMGGWVLFLSVNEVRKFGWVVYYNMLVNYFCLLC